MSVKNRSQKCCICTYKSDINVAITLKQVLCPYPSIHLTSNIMTLKLFLSPQGKKFEFYMSFFSILGFECECQVKCKQGKNEDVWSLCYGMLLKNIHQIIFQECLHCFPRNKLKSWKLIIPSQGMSNVYKYLGYDRIFFKILNFPSHDFLLSIRECMGISNKISVVLCPIYMPILLIP